MKSDFRERSGVAPGAPSGSGGRSLPLAAVVLAVVLQGTAPTLAEGVVQAAGDATTTRAGLTPQMKAFLTAKEQQAHRLAEAYGDKVSDDFWRYFAALQRGELVAADRLMNSLMRRNGQYQGSTNDPSVGTVAFQTLIEACCLAEFLTDAGPHYTELFGQEIIRTVPRGAIYFGGTDSGRGVVSALCKAQSEGDPFFTVTQNALADSLYLKYLWSWDQLTQSMIGKWLTANTPIAQVCEFARRVYLQKDLKGFQGDPAFAQASAAQKAFSKMRSAIGGVYAWRSTAAKPGSEEQQQMVSEADYAFRQALALCPYSPEAVFRYAELLASGHKYDDALLMARTCQAFDPQNTEVADLVRRLSSRRGAQPTSAPDQLSPAKSP